MKWLIGLHVLRRRERLEMNDQVANVHVFPVDEPVNTSSLSVGCSSYCDRVSKRST